MKHIILVNPISGNCKGIKYANIIQRLLKKYDINADIIYSKYQGHLAQITENLAKKETYRFYVVGGDGSLNEVVRLYYRERF